MNFCIYLKKSEPDVSFSSEEHIFPAGIGGIRKLPMQYVSDDFNNMFSKMELPFMRHSLLSLPRQFKGPGKRGKLNPKKATEGSISIMSGEDLNSFNLGYLTLGNPYTIPQIIIDINGLCHFKSDQSFGDAGKQIASFVKNLSKYNGKYILIEDARISKDEIILGFHRSKWYVALSNEDLKPQIDEYIDKIIQQAPFNKETPKYGSHQVKVHQTLEFDDSFFRVCGKIIFNYLTLVKGRDFVLNSCFDPIRDWIVNGGENNFAILTGKETKTSKIVSPKEAHKLFINQVGKSLVGYISFYGDNFETVVKLCDDIDGNFDLEGFLCDWKNREEYSYIDYVQKLNN